MKIKHKIGKVIKVIRKFNNTPLVEDKHIDFHMGFGKQFGSSYLGFLFDKEIIVDSIESDDIEVLEDWVNSINNEEVSNEKI